MHKLDIFGDNRPIPKLVINVKVKANTKGNKETNTWNKVFGYIMKKPRTKYEFLAITSIRTLDLTKITLKSIKELISEEDFEQLSHIERVFDSGLTSDLKAFILAILRIPFPKLVKIINSQATIELTLR